MEKMFYGSAPVLYVKDLRASVDYYCDVLGFECPVLWGNPPSFAMPKREDMIVMLSRMDDHARIQPRKDIWDVYFWVRDAKELYEVFVENGAKVWQEPVVKEQYGNLEFILEDPDGYLLGFAQELTSDAFFEFTPTEDAGSTKFKHLSPVLASADVARDVAWYAEKLGFSNVFDSTQYSEGPMDYAVIGRQGFFMHLQFQFPQDMTSTDVRIEVLHIEAIFREFLMTKVVKHEAMKWKTAWGTKEFGLFDPSGNRITFLEDL
ncbi:MAG: glyoxalase superfamily protein [Bacteroidota bacterium]